jgi:hypothetical protein
MVASKAHVSTHEQSPEVQFLALCEYRHAGVSSYNNSGGSSYNNKEHVDHVRGAVEQCKTRHQNRRTCRKPINDVPGREIDRPEKRSAGGPLPMLRSDAPRGLE